MNLRKRRPMSLLFIAGAALMLSACGGSAAPAPTSAPAPASSPAAAAAAAATVASSPSSLVGAAASPAASPPASTVGVAPTTTSSGAPVSAGKVNANTATVPQIQAALESAGVPNAARWAREVEEYRPYPTNDTSFAKLRQELAKYNPAPDVVEKIISALSL